MGLSRQDGDLYVNGALGAKSLTPPASCIGDAAIVAGAGIQATKCQQQYDKTYAQTFAVTAVSERKVAHVVFGATAKLVALKAGLTVANIGAATITIDLLKNGVSVLSAVITLNSSTTTFSLTNATITGTTAVQGDVFEFNVVATAGGGTIGKGVFASLIIDEDPQ